MAIKNDFLAMQEYIERIEYAQKNESVESLAHVKHPHLDSLENRYTARIHKRLRSDIDNNIFDKYFEARKAQYHANQQLDYLSVRDKISDAIARDDLYAACKVAYRTLIARNWLHDAYIIDNERPDGLKAAKRWENKWEKLCKTTLIKQIQPAINHIIERASDGSKRANQTLAAFTNVQMYRYDEPNLDWCITNGIPVQVQIDK